MSKILSSLFILFIITFSTLSQSHPSSFADLVEELTPAVVNIATSFRSGTDTSESPFQELPPGDSHENFNNKGRNSLTPITSLGSGFIVHPDGYVVTNHHVIAEAAEITVVLHDNTRLDAKIVGRDPKTDLALLKIEGANALPFVKFGDSDAARVGDWVIAIGNPFGLGNTVTAGIISGRGRDINAGPYDDFLQTDAPINKGNSGGPMFDMSGNVIGVNTLIFSPSGGSVGIGFATPSYIAAPVIKQLQDFGQTRRGWLGVRIQSVSAEIAKNQGLDQPKGALISKVIKNSPADEAGLLSGDIILSFDRQELPNRRALPRIVAATDIGSYVPIVVWRNGKLLSLEVKVGHLERYELDSTNNKESKIPLEVAFPSIKLVLTNVSDDILKKYNLPKDSEGIVVKEIARNWEERIDLRPGDIIVQLEEFKVTTTKEFSSFFTKYLQSDFKEVIVLRKRENRLTSVRLRIYKN